VGRRARGRCPSGSGPNIRRSSGSSPRSEPARGFVATPPAILKAITIRTSETGIERGRPFALNIKRLTFASTASSVALHVSCVPQPPPFPLARPHGKNRRNDCGLIYCRLNLLAKIGLLWYEIDDFRMQRNSTALRTVPRPKLISAGRLVLAEKKPAVFYCQIHQGELEAVSSDEIPCSTKRIPCSSEEQGIIRKALGLQRKPTH
jgi:hypothetical protein